MNHTFNLNRFYNYAISFIAFNKRFLTIMAVLFMVPAILAVCGAGLIVVFIALSVDAALLPLCTNTPDRPMWNQLPEASELEKYITETVIKLYTRSFRLQFTPRLSSAINHLLQMDFRLSFFCLCGLRCVLQHLVQYAMSFQVIFLLKIQLKNLYTIQKVQFSSAYFGTLCLRIVLDSMNCVFLVSAFGAIHSLCKQIVG
ncbi:MAG: hypothetical protein IJ911_05390 [Salinivirgaceae bacterium]|nr:hypothetical protein [Salinivirgaceae bacterium]